MEGTSIVYELNGVNYLHSPLSCAGPLRAPLSQRAQLQTPVPGPHTAHRAQRLQWEGFSVSAGTNTRLIRRQH